MSTGNRPLSPHLQIYKPEVTSALSILHRLTGVVLALGALLLTYWLTSAAYGPEAFSKAHDFMAGWLGRLILFGVSFSLFFHLCNGVRHLFWDIGWGLELRQVKGSGYLVALTALSLTIGVWSAAYILAGRM